MNSALQDAVAEVPNLVAIQNKLNDYGMAELVVKQVHIHMYICIMSTDLIFQLYMYITTLKRWYKWCVFLYR